MNQTMDIMFGILNISALPLQKFQLPKFVGAAFMQTVALKGHSHLASLLGLPK